MFDKIFKWGPSIYLILNLLVNLLGTYLYPIASREYEDVEAELFSYIISAFIILIPLVIFMAVVIKRKENLKWGLLSSLWIWLFAYMMISSALKADRPCGAG